MKRTSTTGWMAGVAGATLASGWLGVALDKARGNEPSMKSDGAGVWIALPLASATAVRLLGKAASSGGWDPRRARPRWYGVAACAFPVVTAATLAAGKAAGWVRADGLELPRLMGETARALPPSIVKNVFEEGAWRGYFVGELAATGASDAAVYGASGAIWGLWHLPYYLHFLPESEIRDAFGMSRVPAAAVATAVMLAWAVPYAELQRLSGSVWPAVLMHSVEDAFVNSLVMKKHVEIAPERAALVSPVVGVVTSAMYVGLGLALRAVRRRSAVG